MNIKNFLNQVCQEIKYEPVRKEIAEELELHIQDLKEDYMNNGMEELEAEEKAVAQMGIAEEIGKKLDKIHRPKLDWKLLLLIFVLMGFGMLVSILKKPLMNDNYIGNTIFYMIIGVVLSIGVYFFNYKKMKNYSNIIYLIASLMLILPILPMRFSQSDLYNIRIFNVNIFLPAIALPLYMIAFIGYMSNYKKDNTLKMTVLNKTFSINKDFAKILTLCMISLFLMAKVPSMINVLILAVTYLVVTTVKIIQNKEQYIKKLILLYGIILILLILILCTLFIQSPFRLERIMASFNPEIDPQGEGYTRMLQKEILENAKIIGEAETSAISDTQSIINLESNYTYIYLLGKTGILVTAILTFIIILTSLKLIYNSKKIKEEYGKLIIIGFGTLYIVQSFATILMNLNMGIQANINLPFVTYGGVNFIINLLSIALILSIYRRKDINEYEKNDEKKKFTIFKLEENKS